MKGLTTVLVILLVAAVAIIAIFAFGILDLGKLKTVAPSLPTQVIEDKVLRDLKKIGSSDEVADIEKDLNRTNLNDLDQGLGEVEKATSEL